VQQAARQGVDLVLAHQDLDRPRCHLEADQLGVHADSPRKIPMRAFGVHRDRRGLRLAVGGDAAAVQDRGDVAPGAKAPGLVLGRNVSRLTASSLASMLLSLLSHRRARADIGPSDRSEAHVYTNNDDS